MQSTRSAVVSVTVAVLTLALHAQQAAVPKPTEAQQRPIFRGGTHFVRVDAYPLQNGKVVENLQAGDFEVTEDGKPQQIESFDFVRFDTFTPETTRRDPATQREGFDMAADPRNRVFVIFVDMAFSRQSGAVVDTNPLKYIEQPLANFLDRILSPVDLYGFLTSRNSTKDLVLQRRSVVTKSQIADLWRASFIDKDDSDLLFGPDTTGPDPQSNVTNAIKARARLDATYSTLESLVETLGAIRQERKSIVLVTDMLPRWTPDKSILEKRGPVLPRVGIRNGKLGTSDPNQGYVDETALSAEFQRLALMDFDRRYRDLLSEARKQNVSFYPITPGGLQAPVRPGAMRAQQQTTDDLRSLASETDGQAIVETNDLNAGMKRIADDLAAYYVLGYYTTNTKWDGGVRTIKVRLKGTGKEIRARRQYRAPTQEEINALASGAAPAGAATVGGAAASKVDLETPIQAALAVLERASAARTVAAYPAIAGRTLTIIAELPPASVEAGKWKDGADVDVIAATIGGDTVGTARAKLAAGSRSVIIPLPLAGDAWPDRVSLKLRSEGRPSADEWVKVGASGGTLVGDPIAYRSAPRMTDSPVAAFEFTRNERIRLEWPLLKSVENRQVRLLDRLGHPFAIDVPLAEDTSRGTPRLIAQLPLAALRGDYLIELTASAGGVTDRRLVAVRVR